MSEPALSRSTAPVKSSKSMLPYKKSGAMLSNEDMKIIVALEDLKSQLNYAHNCLDNITDDILIDSYIFEIQSLNMKYRYYLTLCKDKGIIAEVL